MFLSISGATDFHSLTNVRLLATILAVVVVGLEGCADLGDASLSRQESLGEGIVWGARAARGELQDGTTPHIGHRVAGQVVALEGGAYVLRADSGAEVRIPHDENTTSDRPAHLGDRIEAALDKAGRAVLIRNIDPVTP